MNYTIEEQGAPIPGGAFVTYQSADCIVIELDMTSKYCDLFASSGVKVFIGANASSLRLRNDIDRDKLTVVKFDLPEGNWDLAVGSRSARYTLTFCYLRQKDTL